MKTITKEQYDKLPDFMKGSYKENDDGGYDLVIEGGEDVTALKNAKNYEKEKAKKAKAEARALREKLQELEDAQSEKDENDARAKGDVESLEKRWQKKFDKTITTKDAEIEGLKGKVTKMLVNTVADSLAKDISTVPSLIAPLLQKRLSVDWESDIPKTRVLDPDGEISALSLAELGAEFQGNEEYSAVMIASKASGGAKTDQSLASKNAGSESKAPDFTELTIAQKVERLNELREQRKE